MSATGQDASEGDELRASMSDTAPGGSQGDELRAP